MLSTSKTAATVLALLTREGPKKMASPGLGGTYSIGGTKFLKRINKVSTPVKRSPLVLEVIFRWVDVYTFDVDVV